MIDEKIKIWKTSLTKNKNLEIFIDEKIKNLEILIDEK
jgi:hypothetical protein